MPRGNCVYKSMVYKAEVSTSTCKKHYYGQTFRTFKERFYGHQHDLQNSHKSDSTTLSQYVWKMKELVEQPEISWSKVTSAKSYLLGGRLASSELQRRQLLQGYQWSYAEQAQRIDGCLYKEPFKLSNFYSSSLLQQ